MILYIHRTYAETEDEQLNLKAITFCDYFSFNFQRICVWRAKSGKTEAKCSFIGRNSVVFPITFDRRSHIKCPLFNY